MIDKVQSGFTDKHLSYVYAIDNDKIHLLYNSWKDRKSSFVANVTVNGKGEVKRKNLIDNRINNILLVPKGCKQVTDKELIIYADFRKAFRWGLISY